jgi:hypothetical protein
MFILNRVHIPAPHVNTNVLPLLYGTVGQGDPRPVIFRVSESLQTTLWAVNWHVARPLPTHDNADIQCTIQYNVQCQSGIRTHPIDRWHCMPWAAWPLSSASILFLISKFQSSNVLWCTGLVCIFITFFSRNWEAVSQQVHACFIPVTIIVFWLH